MCIYILYFYFFLVILLEILMLDKCHVPILFHKINNALKLFKNALKRQELIQKNPQKKNRC